jgi:amino acid adenylation domain-containing protein/non-ribosomal peptide synthase protein (TIGR01720 family)
MYLPYFLKTTFPERSRLDLNIEDGVAYPTQTMNPSISLAAFKQRHTLLTSNRAQTEYLQDACIHQLFEIQADRTPNAVALTLDDELLTYRQLNCRANQLAHYLRGLGVGPEVLVGICAERSLDMLVGVLGILKAGAAYVPLDPSYPQERLAFMLEDTQVPVLLTQAHLLGKLPGVLQPPGCDHSPDVRPTTHSAHHVVRLDADWPVIAGLPTENPDSGVTADNLAYVIYTSGSTGRPKGVLIEHAGVCNQLIWRQSAYPLTRNDCVLHTASLSFDISVWELFGPLLAGARIVMAAPGQQRNTAELAALIARRQITILQLPTPLLRVLLDEPALAACDRLRHICCGGEALTIEIQAQCAARLPEAALHNLYGPTEATIEATFWDCQTDDGQGCIPIGRPIANKQIYILDEHLVSVPIGTPGELHIGGIGLARGYLNHPELTAEKFIPSPWSVVRGPWYRGLYTGQLTTENRLYKTGDLARYRPDGAIEFLGRIDHQVKVRGFRIELGEIEAALIAQPIVREAVVLACEDTPGHKHLVAYVVLSDECRTVNGEGGSSFIAHRSSFQKELRSFLNDRLPDYMLPSAFVLLDALPLTPNGKIDRAALPLPKRTPSRPDAAVVSSVSATEALLAQIWADVLGLSQVGTHDNFFELGGDSILSIQLIARAQRTGLRISPKQLFEHPTVAGLAAVAGTAPTVLADQGAVIGPVPLTPIQRWFFEQNFPDPHHWNQAMLLELPLDIDATLLEEAFQLLLVQHDALRLRFTRDDEGWRQINAPTGGPSPFIWVDMSGLPKPVQRSAIEAIAARLQSSLDLAHTPRLRAMLFDLGTDRPGRLLIVVNYLAIDGVSWRILLEDLQSAYEQLRQGQPIVLPTKTTSYQQWARRLADYARSTALRQQLAYWLDEIRLAEPAIPLDYPDGANTIASARSVSISLSADETRALLQEVPKTYHTQINDVLLAALLRAWVGWTGSRSLLITLESHGREDLFDDVDLSRTVGWFTSFFPVLLQLEDAEDPEALLIATKERLRRIPDHGIGHSLLRYLTDDDSITEQLRALPKPNLRFNYLGQFDQVLSGASLFRRARESYGLTRSSGGQRTHVLIAEGLVAEGQLHFTWTYSANLHRHNTIEQLANRHLAELRALIEHCLSPAAGAFSPSDFLLAGLNQQQLDSVAMLINDLND